MQLLKADLIGQLVDVRPWPMARRHPHFNREALAASLKEQRVDYLRRQDLGGFRKTTPDPLNTAWRVATLRIYADFMLTAEFARIIGAVEALATVKPVAIMCAEAFPWHYHRQLLAGALLARTWRMRCIMDDGCHPHKLVPYKQQIFFRELL